VSSPVESTDPVDVPRPNGPGRRAAPPRGTSNGILAFRLPLHVS
jgi:hypothetical protein